jgi:glycosyltransferase involved in cell wall biosynthesis
MKISGFSIIRNGTKFDYPYIESIRSILPLVDEMILNVGYGEDDTLKRIKNLNEPKIKVFESDWQLDDPEKKKSGLILSEQTNLALEKCTGDWCVYLQADEVLHEADLENLKALIKSVQDDRNVEGLIFDYNHFYGSYNVVQYSRSVYRREVRAFRNTKNVMSIGDAQSFRKKDGSKLRVIESKARIYHYGWVRTPEAMKEKTFFMDQLYHGEPTSKQKETGTPHTGDNYRYKKFWGLRSFNGTHPATMVERIQQKGWNWEIEKSPYVFTSKDIKKVVLDTVETYTGKRLFEYKSFELVKNLHRPRAAVVISTYNNPKFLGLCLKSFANQSVKDFDIFIADDGSDEKTKQKIDSLRHLFKCKVEHVWHPDEGYRKATINNIVFKKLASYPVTICVDGDVVCNWRFVEDHLIVHQKIKRACVMGRRVDLSSKVTSGINEENVFDFNRGTDLKQLATLFLDGIHGNTKNVMRSFRINNPILRNLFGRNKVSDLLGSNFSVATSLLLEVNGYNEDFKSYWGEDGDLFIRLRNIGAKLVGLKSLAVQFHLDHPRLNPNPESQKRYLSLLNDFEYRRCTNGILKESGSDLS